MSVKTLLLEEADKSSYLKIDVLYAEEQSIMETEFANSGKDGLFRGVVPGPLQRDGSR